MFFSWMKVSFSNNLKKYYYETSNYNYIIIIIENNYVHNSHCGLNHYRKIIILILLHDALLLE